MGYGRISAILSFTVPVAVFCQIQIEDAFPNLTFAGPLDLQHAPDGSNRLFVVEQAGIIQVFENDSNTMNTDVFLDIQDRVDDMSHVEMGLLGLAFHPNYEDNGYFYVDYTAGDPKRTIISRFRVDPANPDSADVESEFIILEILQRGGSHNGGQIVFGPDGYLYIAMGDGGGLCRIPSRSIWTGGKFGDAAGGSLTNRRR